MKYNRFCDIVYDISTYFVCGIMILLYFCFWISLLGFLILIIVLLFVCLPLWLFILLFILFIWLEFMLLHD